MIVNEKQIEYIISLIETRKKTYDEIAAGSGISRSTISRLVKQRNATAYTIDMLASYFEVGEAMAELGGHSDEHSTCPLISGVSNELKRLDGLYAERESRLQAQSDERVASIKAQMDMLQLHHSQALTKRDETYERSVNYLKTQVDEMRKERAELREMLEVESKRADAEKERADALDSKRHNVFWGMLVIIILLLILMGVMIGVDAPGIGMGWG